jgi:hypothetical protein
LKLKNIYTNEEVFTDKKALKRIEGDMTFILVFKESDPGRKYWVNESAFKPMHK